MRRSVACLCLTLAIPCLPSTAQADPLTITSGHFVIDHEGDFFRFFGPSLAIHHVVGSEPDPNYGLWVPKVWEPSCFISHQDGSCQAGETVNLSFRTPDAAAHLGVVDATIDGATYSNVTLRGSLDFRVEPFVLPLSGPQGFVGMTSPFNFLGVVRGLRDGAEVFSVSLAGRGRASAPLERTGDTFVVEEGRVDYIFDDAAPVPEPATLLLLGSGLAALAGARRRHRRSSHTAHGSGSPQDPPGANC